MTINLIASVVKYKNKLGIGYLENNDLIVRINEDLAIFKSITKNDLSGNEKCTFKDKNVVLMGYKTWKSIGNQNGLPDRINIVLTQKYHEKYWEFSNKKNVYFMTFDMFELFYNKNHPNVFVIGGGVVYDLFMTHPNMRFRPHKLFISHIHSVDFKVVSAPTVFFPRIHSDYKMLYYSRKKCFDFICYVRQGGDPIETFDQEYKKLIRKVINIGSEKVDRTGVGTISLFGESIKLDVSDTVPLLTSKFVNWKSVVEELLWFLRGDTDAKILQKKGIKIWDGNTSKEFLEKRGLDYNEGILGPGYGWQWRNFGAEYDEKYANTAENISTAGYDQIEKIVEQLKNEPESRRIVLSAWNPEALDKMALVPCHLMAIFNVTNGTELNCHLICRSTDVGLGLPYNIFSYYVLMKILALKTGLSVKYLYYTGTDVHIYKNHKKQLIEQLTQSDTVVPKMVINSRVKDADFRDISIDDFDVIGYFPNKYIKMDMAV